MFFGPVPAVSLGTVILRAPCVMSMFLGPCLGLGKGSEHVCSSRTADMEPLGRANVERIRSEHLVNWLLAQAA